MTWEEIVQKQANEYKDYLNGSKERHDQLKQHKADLLKHMKCDEASLPESMKAKLASDKEEWKERWGMYGTEFKTMRIAHQKEIDKFIYKENLVQDLGNTRDKKQEKEKGAGR